jgi:protein-S-isoprenylcysteine O-methyltransferase Ste14
MLSWFSVLEASKESETHRPTPLRPAPWLGSLKVWHVESVGERPLPRKHFFMVRPGRGSRVSAGKHVAIGAGSGDNRCSVMPENQIPSRAVIRLLVGLQFLFAGALALSGAIVPTRPGAVCVAALGCALAVWAIWIMRPGHFNVTPEPHPSAEHVVRGPYRLVRHPMYVGLLLVAVAWVWDCPTALRMLLCVALAVVLDRKARIEERLLAARFASYAEYSRRTARFVPWLY